MSFRSRLTLFFVLIVVVPMVSLTFVLFRLIADNENGKADAGLAARQESVQALTLQARDRAGQGADRLVRDQALATALQEHDLFAAQRRAGALLRTLDLKRIVIARPGERPTIDVGSRTAVFPVRRPLRGADGTDLGVLQVAAQGPKAFVVQARRVADADVVVRRDGRALASTLPAAAQEDLSAGRRSVDLDGTEYRVGTVAAPAFAGETVEVSVLRRTEDTSDQIRTSRLFAAGILLGFFVLAFTFAVLVSRSLQKQIAGFLDAARRLGRGDFSAKVPTLGNDEFAALGGEFNKMGSELEQRLTELEAEQQRVNAAMRRIGETFASNLDRDALLEIVLQTALEATNALTGRALLRERGATAALRPAARAGLTSDELVGVQEAAEAAALDSGRLREHAARGLVALAAPLPSGGGVVSVARSGGPFTPGEQELFAHLVSRAGVSLENVALHQAVARQAVTDGLTGLSNRRRLDEALGTELERSRRFDAPLAFVMLDIDDFSKVNNTHGHQVGDDVLRGVARVLRESSREIDEPARYGGEELAVVLPGTDLEGAFNLAERVRTGIEALGVTLPDGTDLHVTASFGAAAGTGLAGVDELVQAADAALYAAKRAGKNRTVRAAPSPR